MVILQLIAEEIVTLALSALVRIFMRNVLQKTPRNVLIVVADIV